jgi:hypothetical protein
MPDPTNIHDTAIAKKKDTPSLDPTKAQIAPYMANIPQSDLPKNPSQPVSNIESTYNLQGIKPGPMKAKGQPETNYLPNTNPAARLMGLSESDIAPGNQPKPAQPVEAPPATTPEPVAGATQTLPPVGQAKSATGAGPVTTEVSGGTDSIKAASSTPGFWQQALDVAGKTGKTIMELIGDFASGYSHQQTSPTEQRIGREHELRMQGNQVQAQKDLVGIQQGFQKQQADLDRQLQTNLAGARNDIEREKMKQDYQYQTQSLRNQSLQIQNQYQIEMLNRQLMIAANIGTQGSFLSRHQ